MKQPVCPVLSAQDLSVSYGKVQAVSSASLEVLPASIVCVIGSNGAGKSTLLNSLMGLTQAKCGSIRLANKEQIHQPIASRVANGLCLVPERRELFGSMSVEDNLILGAHRRVARERKAELARIYDRFPRLKDRRWQLAGTLSGGERQILAMGRALMSRPRMLMLDEPSLGLAPRVVTEILQMVVELRSTGVSILLVEQNARAALEISDFGYLMELGRITKQGAANKLLQESSIIESYLGSHSREEAASS